MRLRSFICPAHRPLVQTNKLAKAQVMAYKNALKAKAEAEKAEGGGKMSQIVAGFACHVTTKNSTAVIMRDVLIALCPALIAGCVVFWAARAAGSCGHNGGLYLLRVGL